MNNSVRVDDWTTEIDLAIIPSNGKGFGIAVQAKCSKADSHGEISFVIKSNCSFTIRVKTLETIIEIVLYQINSCSVKI